MTRDGQAMLHGLGAVALWSTLIGLVLILGGLALQQCQETPSPASHESN